MTNSNLEVTVKIDPSSVEFINLIRAANSLLEFRQGIISKEFDKFSPTLTGALHDLATAVKAAEIRCVHAQDNTDTESLIQDVWNFNNNITVRNKDAFENFARFFRERLGLG